MPLTFVAVVFQRSPIYGAKTLNKHKSYTLKPLVLSLLSIATSGGNLVATSDCFRDNIS